MNNQTNNSVHSRNNKLRFSYISVVASLVLLGISLVYSSWRSHAEHEANLPICGIETVVVALRSFHKQTGRFPKDFRELDERIWKEAKREQISEDGKSLNAPTSHYHYTLHTVNQTKAAIWAVPTGSRSNEAATYFWYITPTDIERWMGPALTSQNIRAIKSIPTEQQLALLVMNKQTANNVKEQTTIKLFLFLFL